MNDRRKSLADSLADCVLEHAQRSGDLIGYLRKYRERERRRHELLEQMRAKRPQAVGFSPEALLADLNEANRLLDAELATLDGD